MPTSTRPNIILHTMPGLQQIAWRELRAKKLDAHKPRYAEEPGRNGLVAVNFQDELESLLSLQCVEDVFGIVLSAEVGLGQSALDIIDRQVPPSLGRLRQVLSHRNQLYPRHARHKQIRFRVISRMASGSRQDDQPSYTRHALERHTIDAVQRATRHQWLSVSGGEDVELWTSLVGAQLFLALRLSSGAMRQRRYKIAHLPASLRPSVAAAMALLSQPRPDDVVLDPMCGAGTLLIERAMMSRHAGLLGYDIDEDAVAAARANFGPRHKPRQVQVGDATALELPDGSVTTVLCNLPFGKQIAQPDELPALYRAALGEMLRVTQTGGRWVLMTSAAGLLRDIATSLGRAYLMEAHRIQVLGQRAEITVWGVA